MLTALLSEEHARVKAAQRCLSEARAERDPGRVAWLAADALRHTRAPVEWDELRRMRLECRSDIMAIAVAADNLLLEQLKRMLPEGGIAFADECFCQNSISLLAAEGAGTRSDAWREMSRQARGRWRELSIERSAKAAGLHLAGAVNTSCAAVTTDGTICGGMGRFRWRATIRKNGCERLQVNLIPGSPRNTTSPIIDPLSVVIGRRPHVGRRWYNPDIPLCEGSALQGEVARAGGLWVLRLYNLHRFVKLRRDNGKEPAFSGLISELAPHQPELAGPVEWQLQDGDELCFEGQRLLFRCFGRMPENMGQPPIAALCARNGATQTVYLVGAASWRGVIRDDVSPVFMDDGGHVCVPLPVDGNADPEPFCFHLSWSDGMKSSEYRTPPVFTKAPGAPFHVENMAGHIDRCNHVHLVPGGVYRLGSRRDLAGDSLDLMELDATPY